MSSFEFLKNQLPFGYAYNFENFLFNKVKHMNLQGPEERVDFFLVNSFRKRIEAKIHFLVDEKKAYSPFRSLFGGIEMNPRIATGLVSEFISYCTEDLRKSGINELRLVQHASCYNPLKTQKIDQALTTCHFQTDLIATNHFFELTQEPLDLQMHAMEYRKLKKCKNAGFQFQEESAEKATEVYNFLEKCRAEKGLPVSIPQDLYVTYLTEFPTDYKLFAIRDNEKIVAATMTIRVCKRILYNFLPASLEAYNSFSPMVMLLAELYNYALSTGYEILDLGISTTADGKNQDSLIAFKENMGAKRDDKRFYSLRF